MSSIAGPESEELVGGFAEARDPFVVEATEIGGVRMRTILSAARDAGLLEQKTARISGRISPALIEQAKRSTGIASDTDLIEYALASVALEDGFAAVFRRSRGMIDPDLSLGF